MYKESLLVQGWHFSACLQLHVAIRLSWKVSDGCAARKKRRQTKLFAVALGVVATHSGNFASPPQASSDAHAVRTSFAS